MKDLLAIAIVITSLLIGFFLAGAGTVGILGAVLVVTVCAVAFIKVYGNLDMAPLFAMASIVTAIGAGIRAFVFIASKIR